MLKQIKSLPKFLPQNLVTPPVRIVLCKRNANEIRCFSLFVLGKIRRNFATKRNFSSSKRNFVLMTRNFVLINDLACEISPTLEQQKHRNFATFSSEAKVRNLIAEIRVTSLISANFVCNSFAQYCTCSYKTEIIHTKNCAGYTCHTEK